MSRREWRCLRAVRPRQRGRALRYSRIVAMAFSSVGRGVKGMMGSVCGGWVVVGGEKGAGACA